MVIKPRVVTNTSAEGRPVKEKVSRYKTSGLISTSPPAHHYYTKSRQPIFQGESKGGLRGRAAILDGSSRSEVPTAIPLSGFQRQSLWRRESRGRSVTPFAPCGRAPAKRKEFYFIKFFWARASPAKKERAFLPSPQPSAEASPFGRGF